MLPIVKYPAMNLPIVKTLTQERDSAAVRVISRYNESGYNKYPLITNHSGQPNIFVCKLMIFFLYNKVVRNLLNFGAIRHISYISYYNKCSFTEYLHKH